MKINETTSKQYWDLWWNNNKKIIKLHKWDKLLGPDGSFIRIMKNYLGNLYGLKILEIGGASSYYSLALSKWEGAIITLLDYSVIGIENSKTIFKKNNCNAEFLNENLFNWQPKDGLYDVIVHWGLLEHYANPEDILNKCFQFVKPGGKIIFTMPNMLAKGSWFWKNLNKSDWEKHIYHSDETIQKSCGNIGLNLLDKFYWGAPLIQISPINRNEFFKKILHFIQYITYFIGMLIPIYHLGSVKISMHRGFVIKKPY
jgi:2-polyprenyl-3-methyl-5-hydroxy-6-metoxy-1,4-benzoquinol methylase